MLQALSGLFTSSSFLPHGYCLAWDPLLLWTLVIANSVIGISYFSIPVALARFIRRQRDLKFRSIFLLFGAFILACGTTHFIGVLSIWHPVYRLDAAIVAVTAGASMATALLLWPLLPRIEAFLEQNKADRRQLVEVNGRQATSVEQLMVQRAELTKSESRFRLIVNNAPIGMAVVALDGHFISVNQALCTMLGYSESELLSRTFQDITHLDDLKADLDQVQSLIEGKADTYRMEKRYIHNAGRIIAVQLDVAVFRNESREPVHFISQIQDITERRAADQKLRESEQRFRLMVDGVMDYSIVMLDCRGKIASWNRGAERLNGYSADEIVGRHFSRFYTDDDKLAYKPERELAIAANEGQYEEEGWRLRKDGSRFWASVLITAVRNDAGELIGYSKVARDLTERKRFEEGQQALTQRLTLALRASGIGVWDWHVETNAIAWDDAMYRIYGTPPGSVVDYSVWRGAVMPADLPRAEEGLQTAIARKATESREFRITHPQLGTRYIEATYGVVLDHEQNVVRLVGVNLDVTDRRLAEQSAARANNLRQAILKASPFSIVATNPDGLITAANPAFERMLWYKAEEVVGKATPLLVHDPREVSAQAAALSNELGKVIEPGFEVFAHKARFGITEEREWSYVRKDGSTVPVNEAVTALRDDHGDVTGFLSIAYDITERKRREDYAQHVAHHDFLTGLPNRALLHDRMLSAIQRAKRERGKMAALLIDLDHFKRINDSLGHHVGDQLLQVVSERILKCVRATDTVARMGGDEFAVVLSDIAADRDIEHVAAAMVETISAPLHIGGHELLVTPSIGVSRYPDDGEEIQPLLMNADSAMYRAKADGRQGYRLFSRDMEIAAKRKMDLEHAMRQALRLGEFRLHYQPQVSLNSGEVIGMEALLRWSNPQRGVISPVDFIPVAEESALILEIGEWVLATACRDAKLLQLATGRPLRVAVNLSPRQFRGADLLNQVTASLEKSRLSPAHLELEITEGVLMSHTQDTVDRLNQIRALGVSIAVDDFGVGFSSLSYITKFPISTLKIDQVFVGRLPESACDAAVAQAIIALAHSLNINVVAEGVETNKQLDYLLACNCTAVQGPQIGGPVPLEQFSVQGFHFSKALSVEMFRKEFDKMQRRGRTSIGTPR